jgi:hypothetical protein
LFLTGNFMVVPVCAPRLLEQLSHCIPASVSVICPIDGQVS